jgi:hypothetical protein
MKYTFYNPATGQITSTVTFGDQETAALNLSNKSYVEGLWTELEYYIEAGQAVAKSANPSTDDIVYYFNYTTKSWHILEDKTESNARNQRNNQLSQIDRINPIWYASLTEQQQQDLVAYRQHLLAVPQQAGFPTQVDWPAKPTWL